MLKIFSNSLPLLVLSSLLLLLCHEDGKAEEHAYWSLVPVADWRQPSLLCDLDSMRVSPFEHALLGTLPAADCRGPDRQGAGAVSEWQRALPLMGGLLKLEAGLNRLSPGTGEAPAQASSPFEPDDDPPLGSYAAFARLQGMAVDLPLSYSLNYVLRNETAASAPTGRESVKAQAAWRLPGSYAVDARMERFREGPLTAAARDGRDIEMGVRGPAPLLFDTGVRAGLHGYQRERWNADGVRNDLSRGVRMTLGGPVADGISGQITGRVERQLAAPSAQAAWKGAMGGSLGYKFAIGEWQASVAPGFDATGPVESTQDAALAVRLGFGLAHGPHKFGLEQRLRQEDFLLLENPGTANRTTLDYGYSFGRSDIAIRGVHSGRYVAGAAPEEAWELGASWTIQLGTVAKSASPGAR